MTTLVHVGPKVLSSTTQLSSSKDESHHTISTEEESWRAAGKDCNEALLKRMNLLKIASYHTKYDATSRCASSAVIGRHDETRVRRIFMPRKNASPLL